MAQTSLQGVALVVRLAEDVPESTPRREAAQRGIAPGTLGAINELQVGIELARQGYHVFRALSPACPVDLIAYADGVCFRVEVKTVGVTAGVRMPGMLWCRPRNDEWDLLALVAPMGVFVFKAGTSYNEMNAAMRAALATPPCPACPVSGLGPAEGYPYIPERVEDRP